jgi:hypothetical protein
VDGFLLGAETLRGQFPVETVRTVLGIALFSFSGVFSWTAKPKETRGEIQALEASGRGEQQVECARPLEGTSTACIDIDGGASVGAQTSGFAATKRADEQSSATEAAAEREVTVPDAVGTGGGAHPETPDHPAAASPDYPQHAPVAANPVLVPASPPETELVPQVHK